MKDVIKQEIKWCKNNLGTSGKSPAFEEGFIAGLRQALFLAVQIDMVAREDAHWYGVSYTSEAVEHGPAADECKCCAANAKWFKFCPDCGRLLDSTHR